MEHMEHNRYLLVTTTDQMCQEVVTKDHGPILTYEELSAGVGGMIQAIELTIVPGVTMWLNEEGKLLGLAPNPVADALAVGSGLIPGEQIVGDIVLTGSNAEGDAVALTDSQAESLIMLAASAS